ncbi:hypothetical protein [Microbacterium oleivorans]|uniref:hypothetical protein n=1 Tax=Microbacterium oleivorans TaxID=273677 RepID=UPI00203E62C0|nr:hypothetical protein [Microbacterium oleivorans]MCM3695203.1 hypothetical protein [Microbacterium oleivorans]
MDTRITGDTPRNHDEAFLQMSRAAEAADRATRDYRSVFNAHTHKFHQPKPLLGELAAMQGAITQSFAKRYTSETVEAIEASLSEEPDLDAIRTGIRALGFKDLRGISNALDRAIEAAEAQRGFEPWLPSADEARATSRALQDLGDVEL